MAYVSAALLSEKLVFDSIYCLLGIHSDHKITTLNSISPNISSPSKSMEPFLLYKMDVNICLLK